jgi:DNA-binding NarL/FixJ family response regulator
MRSGFVQSAGRAPLPRAFLVVEDDPGFGQRFARMLRKWGDSTVVMTLCDATAAIDSHCWAALFVDPGLPDGSGVELVMAFRNVQPFTPVLMLSGGCSQIEKETAWSLGARYLDKSDLREAIIDDFLRSGAVLEERLAEMFRRREERNAQNGSSEIPEMAALQKRTGLDLLSNRERQVLMLSLLGERSKSIACELGLAASTVRVLLRRAAVKLECRSHQELQEKAWAMGMPSWRRSAL